MALSTSELTDEQFVLKILQIIAQELEVDVGELQEDDYVEFKDLGMGPALASVSVRKIKQATEMQLPDRVFEEFPDLHQFKNCILSNRPSKRNLGPVIKTQLENVAKPDQPTKTPPSAAKTPLSVLIRGSRGQSRKKNVFLLPDGSGSAMAYARIPTLSGDYNLYALNSPFLGPGQPLEFGCTIEALAAIWLQEIVAIQPHGPYVLGGWSAGGYYAFEVTKHFQRRGDTIEKLILIDSPSRTRFEAMPLAVVEYLSTHNLMGNWGGGTGKNATPPWLVKHFAATLKAVDEYKPAAISSTTIEPVEVFVIWAKDSLLTEEEADKTGLDLTVRVSRFLLKRRDNFGPNGWEMLFPVGTKMRIATMPGNHFNIVHPPNVEDLGNLLRDVVRGDEKAYTNNWYTIYT